MNGYKPNNGSPNQNQRKPNGVGQNLHGKVRHPVNPNQPINQNNANKQVLREVRKDGNFSKSQNGLVNQFKSLEKNFSKANISKKHNIFLGVWIGFTCALAIGVSVGVGVAANNSVQQATWFKIQEIGLSSNFDTAIQGINSEEGMNQKIAEAKEKNELATWIQDINLGDVSKHVQTIDATYELIEEKNFINFQIVWNDDVYVVGNEEIKNLSLEFNWKTS